MAAQFDRKLILPKSYVKKRYYTSADVAGHGKGTADCWISFFHKVYDVAELIADYRDGKLDLVG